MTKRVILKIPEGLTFDMLSELQQEAINVVFGQYVNPMPCTIPNDGKQLVDALCIDGFDPALMPQYNIDWEIVAIWQKSPTNKPEFIQAIDEEDFVNFIPDIAEYDEEGNVISTSPPVFKIPHVWCGWEE